MIEDNSKVMDKSLVRFNPNKYCEFNDC